METHAKVVVIGGGVVGCSILFHLAKFGWKDCILLERNELTSGSSWHAAGQIHTISSDPNISRLQGYTINLYKEIEETQRINEKILDETALNRCDHKNFYGIS